MYMIEYSQKTKVLKKVEGINNNADMQQTYIKVLQKRPRDKNRLTKDT